MIQRQRGRGRDQRNKTEGAKDLCQLNYKSQMKSHVHITTMESGCSTLIYCFVHPTTCSEVIFLKPFPWPHSDGLYLQDDVPWQEPAVPGNHPITVNVLDNDMDQRGFAASHKPNGEAFVGIHSIDLDACNFTIWNQVIQPWKD